MLVVLYSSSVLNAVLLPTLIILALDNALRHNTGARVHKLWYHASSAGTRLICGVHDVYVQCQTTNEIAEQIKMEAIQIWFV